MSMIPIPSLGELPSGFRFMIETSQEHLGAKELLEKLGECCKENFYCVLCRFKAQCQGIYDSQNVSRKKWKDVKDGTDFTGYYK